jgi:hypothetical protein
MAEVTIKEGMPKAEFEQAVKNLFDNADKDKNGALKFDEYKGFLNSLKIAFGEDPHDFESESGKYILK